MDDTDKAFDAYTVSPCSRAEAMELAMRMAVVVHLLVCILALLVLATVLGPSGVWIGLGIAAILACAIPFVVLPAAAAIGFLTHLAFHRTELSIPMLVRVLVVLFEASLLGWLILLVVMVS
jgi:hypothetical protein